MWAADDDDHLRASALAFLSDLSARGGAVVAGSSAVRGRGRGRGSGLEAIRQAITEHIETRRRDEAFRARLKDSLERNRKILEKLAR